MQDVQVRPSARRRWLSRLALVAASSLLGLYLADKIVGATCQTAQRHLLRLPGHLSYRHHSTEFDYVFHSNSLGLRGPEIPLALARDAYRIAVLGDSFVAGFGVADEQVLTARLAELLRPGNRPNSNAPTADLDAESSAHRVASDAPLASPKRTAPHPVQVINLGGVGTSTIRELDIYELLGRPYYPDVVVLMYFCGNDLREVVEEQDREETRNWHPEGMGRRIAYGLFPNLYLELAIWRQSGETGQRLGPRSEAELLAVLDRLARQSGVNSEEARERYRRLPPGVRNALKQGTLRDWEILPACYDPGRLRTALFPDDRFFERAWPRAARHLELLRQAVLADGGRLVVAAIPASVQVEEASYQFAETIGYEVERQWLTVPSRTQQSLQNWSLSAQVPYLDMTDELRNASVELYYPQDGHFNPAGHAKAAQMLARFLSENGLAPIPGW
jgi:hypothetical protein